MPSTAMSKDMGRKPRHMFCTPGCIAAVLKHSGFLAVLRFSRLVSLRPLYAIRCPSNAWNMAIPHPPPSVATRAGI